MGYNTLGGVVKKLCRDAGIEGNFTNHSLIEDIGNQNCYYLYLLGILTKYLISYFGRFVAFSC